MVTRQCQPQLAVGRRQTNVIVLILLLQQLAAVLDAVAGPALPDQIVVVAVVVVLGLMTVKILVALAVVVVGVIPSRSSRGEPDAEGARAMLPQRW